LPQGNARGRPERLARMDWAIRAEGLTSHPGALWRCGFTPMGRRGDERCGRSSCTEPAAAGCRP